MFSPAPGVFQSHNHEFVLRCIPNRRSNDHVGVTSLSYGEPALTELDGRGGFT